MCGTAMSTEATIYTVPASIVPTMQAQAGATDDNTSSISFTDNGSLYLSVLADAVSADGNVATADTVSVLGVSQSDGAQTAVNLENITFQPPSDAVGDQQRLSVDFNMTAPFEASVRFVFDVNAISAVLISATPLPKPGSVDALSLATVWCITKNGGAAILPALVKALPTLVGGPAAYLAAVVAQLPAAVIQTAQSVIANCFG